MSPEATLGRTSFEYRPVFVAEHDKERSKRAAGTVRKVLLWIVLPGLLTLGVAYGIEVAFGLWFGVISGLGFICYVLGLFVALGRRDN